MNKNTNIGKKFVTRVQRQLIVKGITIGALCLLFSPSAMAQWQFDPVLRAGWNYDDNATLSVRTDGEEQISGPIGEVSVDMRYDSETSYLSLRPMYRTRNYQDEFNRDSEDAFLRLRYGYEGPKNTFRLTGDYGYEGVRTAELADADFDFEDDPGDIEEDDTGRIGVRQRRDRTRVLPRWTYRFSDVSSITADFTYLTVDYENTLVTNLFDFTDARASVSYRRNISETTAGIFSVTARDYQTENTGGDSSGFGFSAGINRRMSQTTQLRALFGMEQTDIDNPNPGQENLDPNFVTEISLLRQLETTRLLAQYRQRVAASGRGGLRRRDEINLRLSRDLNEKISAGIGFRAYSVDSLDGNANEQNYVQLRGQFVWRITEAVSMMTDYRYSVIDREALGESANSNQVTIWLSYQPNPRGQLQTVTLR